MKIKYSVTAFFLILLVYSNVTAQFDKPVFQLGFGVSEPYNDLRGTYYTTQTLKQYQVLTVNPDLMTNNYGGKTGLNFFGKGKINFDKYSTIRGTLGVSFATFNTFESSKSGNIGVQVININNQVDTLLTSINYTYTFSNFGIGLGLELAPTSFTNLVSPYFGGSFNFNFLDGDLSRTENGRDSVGLSFSGFRMGVTFDAGIEAKVNNNFGLALGFKYDLGNLLLKNTDAGLADAIEYGKQNAELNDEEGRFWSSIYGPILTSTRREVASKQKQVNWGTIYLSANIYLNVTEPKKSKKTTK